MPDLVPYYEQNRREGNPPAVRFEPYTGESAAVDVEIKILVVDFLVLAVRADRLDRGIEFFTQRVLALADGDAGAGAVDHGIDGEGSEDLAALAFLALDPFGERVDKCSKTIDLGRILP